MNISRDKAYLKLAAEEKLPEFVRDMTSFIEIFKREWLTHKKSNGIEVVLLRLAAAKEQAFFRSQQLSAYLKGETETISELEEKLIEEGYKVWENRLFTTSVWKI